MPRCPSCSVVSSPNARFCPACGAALPAQPQSSLRRRNLRGAPRSADWLSLDDILYTRDKRFGAIGTLLVFLGAFAPWATTTVWFWGTSASWGVNWEQAWIVALAGLAASVLLFRKRAGSVVMVIGIVVAAGTLLFALTTLGGAARPSWGVALTLAGSGLLAYSGHLTNEYERGGL